MSTSCGHDLDFSEFLKNAIWAHRLAKFGEFYCLVNSFLVKGFDRVSVAGQLDMEPIKLCLHFPFVMLCLGFGILEHLRGSGVSCDIRHSAMGRVCTAMITGRLPGFPG